LPCRLPRPKISRPAPRNRSKKDRGLPLPRDETRQREWAAGPWSAWRRGARSQQDSPPSAQSQRYDSSGVYALRKLRPLLCAVSRAFPRPASAICRMGCSPVPLGELVLCWLALFRTVQERP
jgi:hypothetical protein